MKSKQQIAIEEKIDFYRRRRWSLSKLQATLTAEDAKCTQIEINYCTRFINDMRAIAAKNEEPNKEEQKSNSVLSNIISESDCDYRKSECTNEGEIIEGKWVCSNHKRTAVCDHPLSHIQKGRDPFHPEYCTKCGEEL